jgi:hypothetical protein
MKRLAKTADATMQATLSAFNSVEEKENMKNRQKMAAAAQAKAAQAELARVRQEAMQAAKKADTAKAKLMSAEERKKRLQLQKEEAEVDLTQAEKAKTALQRQHLGMDEEGMVMGLKKVAALHEVKAATMAVDNDAGVTAKKRLDTVRQLSHEKARESNTLDLSLSKAKLKYSTAKVTLGKLDAMFAAGDKEERQARKREQRQEKLVVQLRRSKLKAEQDASAALKLEEATDKTERETALQVKKAEEKEEHAKASDKAVEMKLQQALTTLAATSVEVKTAEAEEEAGTEQVIQAERKLHRASASVKGRRVWQQHADEAARRAAALAKDVQAPAGTDAPSRASGRSNKASRNGRQTQDKARAGQQPFGLPESLPRKQAESKLNELDDCPGAGCRH